MRRPSDSRLVAVVLLLASLPQLAAAQPADAPPARGVRYFNQDWSFNDVDVATLTGRLARIGLRIPVTITGRISGTIEVGVPWGALGDARAWRLGGSLTSPELTINGFTLRAVLVRLQYRDGVLRLEDLRVVVPPAAGAAEATSGLLDGTAEMQLIPRGRLTATTTASDLPLSTFLQQLAALQPVGGRLSGTLSAEVDVDRLGGIDAWTVTGPVTLEGLTLRNSPPAEASVQVEFRNAVLLVRQLILAIGPASVTSEGRLNLLGDQAWRIDAVLETNELATLLRLINDQLKNNALSQAVEQIAAGALRATAHLAGTLSPSTMSVAGHADLTNLELRPPAELASRIPLKPLRIATIGFDYSLADETLQLSQIVATLAGGQVTGSAALPLGEGSVDARLQWNDLRLAEILDEPFRGPGVSSGRLNIVVPSGDWGDVSRWQLGANASLSELRYGEWLVANLQSGDITLRDGRLSIPSFSAQLDGEPITLALDMQLQAPWSLDATFDVPRFPLAWLSRAPQLAAYANRINGAVGASGRITGAWQPLRLRGNGRLAGSAIQFDEHRIDAVEVDFAISPEEVSLSNLQASLYNGRVAGAATVALGEKIGARAALTWNDIDAAAASAAFSELPVTAAGATDGTLTVDIPPGALEDSTQWTGSASLRLDQLNIYGLPFLAIDAADIELTRGQLRVPQVIAQLDGYSVQAAATFDINAPWTFNSDLHFDAIRLEHLGVLLQVEFLQDRGAGLVDFAANLHGTLDPLELAATGTVAGESLTLFDQQIDRVTFAFDWKRESLGLSMLDATLYDGRVTGDVIIPLADDAPGSATIAWAGIDIGASIGNLTELPFELQGHSDGNAEVTIPAGKWGEFADWNIAAHVSLPRLLANCVVIASLDADLRQQNRGLSYSATGRLLDGVLNAEGTLDPAAPETGLAALGDAQLTLRGASLATATQVGLEPAERPGPVEGTFDVTLISRATPDGWAWRTDLALGQLRVSGTEITSGIRARVAGNDQFLRVEQLSGQFAGGPLRASGQWRFAIGRPPIFRVGVRSARLEQLAALADGADASPLTGLVDVELRVRPAEVWRIAGTVATGQGDFYDVRFSSARVPFDLEWHPASGRVRIQIPSVQISLAGGRITGRLTSQRAYGWMLDGAFRFYRVDVVTLLRQFGSGSQYGKGRLTGTLTMTGRNMRSVNDLRATLLADLEDTQTSDLPVLGDLRNFVPGAAATGASTFGEGRVEARLARGVVNVDELSLASNQLQLYITGLVNLNGRLGLDVIASTGEGNNPLLANALLTRFAAFASAPAALLVAANDFLANRVIHLEIRGTIGRPVIRLRPLATLREEIVRYFLRQAAAQVLGPAAAASVGGGAVDSAR